MLPATVGLSLCTGTNLIKRHTLSTEWQTRSTHVSFHHVKGKSPQARGAAHRPFEAANATETSGHDVTPKLSSLALRDWVVGLKRFGLHSFTQSFQVSKPATRGSFQEFE